MSFPLHQGFFNFLDFIYPNALLHAEKSMEPWGYFIVRAFVVKAIQSRGPWAAKQHECWFENQVTVTLYFCGGDRGETWDCWITPQIRQKHQITKSQAVIYASSNNRTDSAATLTSNHVIETMRRSKSRWSGIFSMLN
jgi:hypothetical protein